MANVMDYIKWRGDIGMEADPFNEVDGLIFALLSNVGFEGIVPASPEEGSVTIREAALEYFFRAGPHKSHPFGVLVPSGILDLFHSMADAPRYRNMRLTGFVNEVSERREMQFSAITVFFENGGCCVAFRGTDDTIVGWKEDFNLSYMEEVPSQRKAVEYLNALPLEETDDLYICGHSKGGNLAVWGAVHADESVKSHIRRVYANDGPGFFEDMADSEAFRALSGRVVTLLPPSSLVGLLLNHNDHYEIVRSMKKGLFQHDGLSWEVMGASFVREKRLSARGTRNDTVVRERLDGMTSAERQAFTRLLFGLLESTGAKTLTDLQENFPKTAMTLVRSYNDLCREDKEAMLYLLGKLLDFRDLTVSPPDTNGPSAGIRKGEDRQREDGPSALPGTPATRRVHVELFPLSRKHRRPRG